MEHEAGSVGTVSALDIRPCTAEDFERFRELGLPGRVIQLHMRRFASQELGERIFFLAWNDDSLMGFGSLLMTSKYEDVRSTAGEFPELNGLEASPQGRGTGTSIIRFAEDEARRLGAERIGIAVERENNGARRLYERLGYSDWNNGFVIDRWFDLDDDGNETFEHVDEGFYLMKQL